MKQVIQTIKETLSFQKKKNALAQLKFAFI